MEVVAEKKAIVPSPVLAIVIFIGTEIMFFAGLISAYLVVRAGVAIWPPIGQPRLPVEATAFNSAVLLASGYTAYRAGRAFASPFRRGTAHKLIWTTIGLGAFFVLFQGYEWVRLIGFGLSLSGSLYGALFYIIIGAHALHVVAALCFMALIGARASARGGEGLDPDVFAAARMFWTFVVAVWPVLYALVYLY
jgi:heme/copper-type cytochrome/quinol oxidase subunit 3